MPILSGSRNTQIVVPVSLNPNELLLPPPFQNRAAPFQLVPASVANLATLSLDLATFQTPLATFFFKAPSDKSSDFWKNLSHLPNVASTVLRARDLELHLSLCLLWSVSAGSGWEKQHIQWPHGSWHRCQWAAHVHTVLPRTNHLPASPLFEIKLFNLTLFSFYFLFISCTYITHCHRALVHSSFWTPLRSLTGLCLRDRTWLYLLIHNNKLNSTY